MTNMQPQYGFSQVAAGVYGRGATLEALTPGARVRGVVVGSAVTVISAQWHGSNAITLTYRDDAGSVAQTLLYRDVEPPLIVEQAARAYAFDGDPNLYRTVVEADGSAMTVRTALALMNHALDEVLTEQEGDFDADTRFCVKWFTQFGWDETDSGTPTNCPALPTPPSMAWSAVVSSGRGREGLACWHPTTSVMTLSLIHI